MREILCIILFSKWLLARPVPEVSVLPAECGTLARCASAEILCVKIKDQKSAVNHHFTLDKCQLQLLKCQPGHVEAAPVPMKFCQGDQLSKHAPVVKKRVRRHLEESSTENINKSTRHGTKRARAIKFGRSHVEKKRARRKNERSLKNPSKTRSGAKHTQKKIKNKPKTRKHTNILRISSVRSSKKGENTKRKPLITINLVPNFLHDIQQELNNNNKNRVKPRVPGSLTAPLDSDGNVETKQGYTVLMDPDDPDGTEDNQGYDGGNDGNSEVNEDSEAGKGHSGVNKEDSEVDKRDSGVNKGDGEADKGDSGVNKRDGEVDNGDSEVNKEHSEADKGDDGVNREDRGADKNGGVNEDDVDANEDSGVFKREGLKKKGDSDADEENGMNDRDGGGNEDGEVKKGDEVNKADSEPDEGDRKVKEDGEANKGVDNEENTDKVMWKGDDEGDNADNVEKVREYVENGNDGKNNVANEGGNKGFNVNDMIARVKKLTNPKIWNSISNGLRSVSVNFNVSVNNDRRLFFDMA